VRPGDPDAPDHDETLAEAAARKLGFLDRIRAHPVLGLVYRTFIAIVGVAVIALGIVLIPAPGPGWLIVFAGLGILATEFHWASRLLRYARTKVRAWTHWVGAQPIWVRGAIGLVGLVLLAAVAYAGYLSWQHGGFPFALSGPVE
jgi:uncharacterized protein (TIGR02611 family)